MRNNVQLYINNELVDLFDFEDININDSIQDVRDIGKVFVPFSRQFTVPASKNNNIIFKHYYNYDIVNGFDARFKISAVIKINGQLYKRGRVTLLGASLSDNKPRNYKLVFYDNTVDLNTLLGDKELIDLDGKSETLDKYKIAYSDTNVFNGFKNGYSLVSGAMQHNFAIDNENPRDLIFPFISSNNYYFYDDADGGSPLEGDTESRNIWIGATGTTKGVYYRDLRGAIRLPILLTAIEEAYGITFSGNFFDTSNPVFNKLYLYLQKERGLYESNTEEDFLLSDASLSSGANQLPLTTSPPFHYEIDLSVTPLDDNDDYSVKVVDIVDNSTVFEGNGKGTNTFVFEISNTRISTRHTLKIVVKDFTSASIDFNFVVKRRTSFGTSSFGVYDYSIAGVSQIYSVSSELPKIKIIDFLTGLFNMFNLTAYVDENGSISVETLDDYYESGSEIDITRYVDTSSTDVSRNKLYSEISFKFEKSSTFAALNSNEITNDVFGDERINNTNDDPILQSLLAFDGGTYEVSPKFEKIMYERMNNQADPSDIQNIGWGWLVDKDQKAVLPKPILFYSENVNLDEGSFWGSLTSYINFETSSGYTTASRYYRPSNSLSTETIQKQSLNFGSEFDEYHFNLGENNKSLFDTYWKNTILAIYDEKSRIVSVSANLPASIINTIKLNDVLVINMKKYRINKLDINITTGHAKLELITYRQITPIYNDAYRVDSDIITVDSDIITVDTI